MSCNVTGNNRRSAHWSCNINLKLTKKVPVIFHISWGYDSHLIMQEINKFNVKLNVIPNGLKKYMAFTINNNLIFVDSMHFMTSSLDSLVKNLSDGYFKYLSQQFSGETKGVDPYEYMDSFKKFSEAKLPNRCEFYSYLQDGYISEKDYLHAFDVWNGFKMNIKDDDHDHYLKGDVLLLADVFKNFINTCLECYGLDPSHYFSSPGLSWDAMLKMTKIELQLISDVDM